jgi:lipopolysaccharide transport system ATP-binding protein
MSTVISVENLSKSYRLGQIGTGRLIDDLRVWSATMRGKPNPLLRIGEKDHENRDNETIWALKDVSFSVEQGAVLGIIGRNGAGKSTLLKILSQVTAPTSGAVKVKGRIASLLEVGTGFHPELTGRENIYLNGSILGMVRSEIHRKFDEIVAFAVVERFLDTPVKRYSSGMYVRLAFSVAAHLEPNILLVDEVLAVGDAEFQQKCLGKMGDVAHEGRTMLFVSHNMAAVSGLCNRTILLQNGLVTFDGPSLSAIKEYLRLTSATSTISLESTIERQGDGRIRFSAFYCQNEDGTLTSHFTSGQTARLIINYKSHTEEELSNIEISIVIFNDSGYRLTNLSSDYFMNYKFVLTKNKGQFICTIPKLPFRSGKYKVSLFCKSNEQVLDWIKDLDGFTVTDGDYFHSGRITGPNQGVCFVEHHWAHSNI